MKTFFLRHLFVIFLFLICFFQEFVVEARKQNREIIDSLLKDLPNVKDDSQKVRNINEIAYLYNSIDPAEGLKFAKEGIELSGKMGLKKVRAFSYNVIATNYETQGDYAQALDYFKKALTIYEEGEFLEDIGVSKEYIGNVLVDECDFPNALKYYNDVVKINTHLKDNYNLARNYGNIATIYEAIGDYTLAYFYDWKSLNMQKEFADKYASAIIYVNLAIVYKDQGKYDSAIYYGTKGLENFEETGDKNTISIILCNLGEVYKNLKNYGKALECCNKSYQITSGISGYRKSMYNTLGNMGEIYLQIAEDPGKINPNNLIPVGKRANLEKAIEFLSKAVAGCREIKDKIGIIEFSKYLADADRLSGNSAGAIENYRQYINLKDSVFSPAAIKEIANLENVRLLEIKNKVSEQYRTAYLNKRMELIVSIGIVAVLLVVIIVLFKSRKTPKNTK